MQSTIRILAVRGQPEDGDDVGAVLNRSGEDFRVDTVTGIDGMVGRLEADADAFDCVVVDRGLSSPLVRDALDAVHERRPALPVVVATDAAATGVAADAIDAGATEVFQWPATEQATLLARRVRTAVSSAVTTARTLTPSEWTAVFEHVDCGVAIVELSEDDCRYRRCNERLAELAGTSVPEIEGRTPIEVFGPEHGPDIEARYRECLDGDEAVSYTIGPESLDGRVFHEAQIRPIGSGGDAEKLLVAVREVTSEHERQAELRQSRRRLRALFEHSPDMINVHDAEGRIVETNAQMREMTGYDESTLTDMSVWDLDRAADPERARSLWEEMEPGDRRRSDGEFRCRDGTTFPTEVHIRCLGVDDGERFLAISRDVSDQRERERELQRKNDRLEEFVSVVSHDLRNPLQVLRGALDGAAETGDRAHFERGHRAIDRMEDMIIDILALARQGDAVGEFRTVPLAKIVETSWQNLRTADATLVVETDLRIRASEIRLRQLLENLLRNAVEHAGADTTVRVGTLSDGFYVADDGRGIPAADRDRVFDTQYSTAPNGTGFGLAIVSGIADAHGWRITLTESEDGGARFEFSGVTIDE
ncbi:hybrid sensor histidine kinase/response regulator [Halomicrobium katesii]|uniref:hybrid sensor histidine kinase/response regulator n=1 Tax=Halomicrobium katesii TaxID=437163 RepID=UPI0003727CF7|nr:PAS domain S-box protein [Halomicrobium katesii]